MDARRQGRQGGPVQPNRNYKDTLFRDLFGSPERKEYALSLYNALAGSRHNDPDELELTTIGGILYLGHKNDVSFLLGDELVLWEHQSTPNPNMPLRGLMYFAQLYRRHLDKTKQSELSRHLIELPTPRYFVFYNGIEERPEREVLRLSDAYSGEGDIELTVTVLNINEGYNDGIMEACQELKGYAHLTALFRERVADMGPRAAMDAAVEACMRDGLLVDYLGLKRSEVIDMLLKEWSEEEYRELALRVASEDGFREGRENGFKQGQADGFKEGREKGFKQGREDGLKQGREDGLKQGREDGLKQGREEIRRQQATRLAEFVRRGEVSAEVAAAILGVSLDELELTSD